MLKDGRQELENLRSSLPRQGRLSDDGPLAEESSHRAASSIKRGFPSIQWKCHSLFAAKAGRALRDWIGNPAAWAGAFWRTYNLLKHQPSYQSNDAELFDLAESARHVLGAVLLDRAAGTLAASRSLFRHYRLNALGDRLRSRFP
jgi:hypothetical protein